MQLYRGADSVVQMKMVLNSMKKLQRNPNVVLPKENVREAGEFIVFQIIKKLVPTSNWG